MSLGKRLKIERIRKGVTTREVSKKFNLGKSTISNYENDYRKPDAEMIRKLAEYYGVTADYLLGLTEHRNVKVLKEDSLPEPYILFVVGFIVPSDVLYLKEDKTL